MGVPLRPEGISIDRAGEGLACYCKEPDDSDASRESVILSTFAGCYAQNRFCEERSYPKLEPLAMIWSLDWNEARGMLLKMSASYLGGRSIPLVQQELERKAQQRVAQHWDAVASLAGTLLAQEWQPLRPLPSGGQWSKGATAKYVTGDEATSVLARHGIIAVCTAAC
jgi:hypothetical protein